MPDQDPESFLQKVEEKQRALADEIGVFLKGYQRTSSESDTDLSRLESDVEQLAGSGDETGKKRMGKGDRKK